MHLCVHVSAVRTKASKCIRDSWVCVMRVLRIPFILGWQHFLFLSFHSFELCFRHSGLFLPC
jgi:hypothetical protein